MEQDPNHIDKLLRQRLHDATAPPPDFVWPRVEAALRKRRRRFLFFWLFGTGLLAAGALGWWLKAADGIHPVSVKRAEQTTATNSAAPLVSTTKQAEKGQPEIEERPVIASNNTPTTDKTTTAVDSKSDKKVKTSLKSSPTATPGPADLPEPIATTTQVYSEPLEKRTSETDPLLPLFSEKPVEESLAHALQMTALPPRSRSHALTVSPSGPLTARFSLPTSVITPQIIRKNKKETRNCYDFAQHPNVFLLDAYLGPSLTRKEMRTGPDNQPYLAQRRNTERPDWAFNAGIRASLLLDRHFLLRTGLHYDQINEVFEYIDPNSVEVIIRQTTQIVNGQPVTVIDTLGVEYGEHYLKTYNRFGMLDIPLEVGVELRNGRTGISLNGGVALNVLFWKRGAILSPVDGRPAYFTPEKGTVDVFRANAGLSAMGSLQWFCHLRPRLRVFAEPYVRMVLRPVNIPDHPVEQHYGILGLNIGMTRILD